MSLYVDIRKKLSGFNLKVRLEGAEETIGLLGASGSGKSMTLRCIAGLIKPDEGRIVLNGRVLFDSEKKINVKPRERKVGFFFQNYALFPHLTVYENISFGLSGLSREEKRAKVLELMKRFHLAGLENRYPSQVSGGQQQRIALARVIAPEPDILLLDEPFSALDNHLRHHMVKEMEESLKYYRKTVLFVTHNMEEAYRLSTNLAVLHNGEVHALGTKRDIFENPPTIEAARITGWKNIFEAIRVDDYHVEIPALKIRLKISSRVNADKGYVCIRADKIRVTDGKQGFSGSLEDEEASYSLSSEVLNSCENIFSARVTGYSEGPFSQTVYLGIEDCDDSEDCYLQCEIAREEWEKIRNIRESIEIDIPSSSVVFISM